MLETKDRRQILGKGYVSVPSIASVPLGQVDRSKHQLVVAYKALAFHEDRKNSSLASVSSFVIEEKRIPPIFNPDLGVYQCAEGTRYGGRFTDKFGRGCGGGILRRLGSALGRLDNRLGRGLEGVGERRDLRRLARYSARQTYRDEIGRIRREYPSLGRRALRRLGGTFRRVDNNLGVAPQIPTQRRRLRGRTPGQPSIIERARQRSGRALQRFRPRRRQGAKPKRVKLSDRVRAWRQQRAATPRTPGIISRFADRAGSAYERLIDRVLTGPQGRRGRRGVPRGQGGTTVVLPKRPKTQRAKKKKAVVQKTKPKPATPQKKIKKADLIDVGTLTAVQKKQLQDAANAQLDSLEKYWRKRLGLKDTDPIDLDAVKKELEDAIADYEAKKAAGTLTPSDGVKLGVLKANANDIEALNKFFDKLSDGDADAFAELNKLGPTRRQKLLDEIGVTTKPKPTEKPKPKPKKPKAPVDKTPETPEAEPEEVQEPEAEIVPEEEAPTTEDLPEFLQPEEGPEATADVSEEPEQEDLIEAEPAEALEEIIDEVVEEPTPDEPAEEEPSLPDFLQPEELEDEDFPETLDDPGSAVIEDPISIPDPLPPIPDLQTPTTEELNDPYAATELAIDNAAMAAGQESAFNSVQELLDDLGVGPNGELEETKYAADAQGLEEAIEAAKAISQKLQDIGYEDEIVAIAKLTADGDNEPSYIVTMPSLFNSDNYFGDGGTELVPTFKGGKALGTIYKSKFETLVAENKPTTKKTWTSAGIVEKSLTTKGLQPAEVSPLLNDIYARSKATKKNVVLISATNEKGKTFLIGGNKKEVVERIKALGLDKKTTRFSLVAAVDHLHGQIWVTYDANKPMLFGYGPANTNPEVKNGDFWLDESTLDLDEILDKVDARLIESASNSDGKFSTHTGTANYYDPWPSSIGFKDIETLNYHIQAAQSGGYRKFKLMRRPPSSGKNTVAFSISMGSLNSSGNANQAIGTLKWSAASLPNEAGVQSPYSLLASLGPAADEYGYINTYLIRIKTSTGTRFQIVDENRFTFLKTEGLIGDNDVFVTYAKNYGSYKFRWNTKFSFDGTTSSGSSNFADYSPDDLPLMTAAIAAKYPDQNLPVEKYDDSVIEIDETYMPGMSTVTMVDPDLAKSIITNYAQTTEAGQNFIKAAKFATKNDILNGKPLTDVTPESLESQLKAAQNELELALKKIPSESSAYGAIANSSKASHNKALKALAKTQAIEELIDQKKKQDDISQLSKTIGKALGVPEFTPAPLVDVIMVTPQNAAAIAATTDFGELMGAGIASTLYSPYNVDNWFPSVETGSITYATAEAYYQLKSVEDSVSYWLTSKLDDTGNLTVTAAEYEAKYNDLLNSRIKSTFSAMTPYPKIDGKEIKGDNLKAIYSELAEFVDQMNNGSINEEEFAEFLDGFYEKALAAIRADVDAAIASGEITEDTKFNTMDILSWKLVVSDLATIDRVGAKKRQLALESSLVKGLIVPSDGPAPVFEQKAIVDLTNPVPHHSSKDINLTDTFGIMQELSADVGAPFVLWSTGNAAGEPVFVVSSYDEMMEDGAESIFSIVGGVTPNGAIYIAETSQAVDNPKAKWISKFGKYGTGGFKAPVGAKYVFESEDQFENLDQLSEAVGKLAIQADGSGKWGLVPLSQVSAKLQMDAPSIEGGQVEKISFPAEDASLNPTEVPYMQAKQIFSAYGLGKLMLDLQKDPDSLSVVNSKRSLHLVAGEGEHGPSFYLLSIGEDDLPERLAFAKFLEGKYLLASMYRGAGDYDTEISIRITDTLEPTQKVNGEDSSLLKAIKEPSFDWSKFSSQLAGSSYGSSFFDGTYDSSSKEAARMIDRLMFQAKQNLAKKSGTTLVSQDAVDEWFEGQVPVLDIEDIFINTSIFRLPHSSNTGLSQGYSKPIEESTGPYEFAANKHKGTHLLVPYLDALFSHLNEKALLPDSSALVMTGGDSTQQLSYSGVAGKIKEGPETPLGRLLEKLDEYVEAHPNLKTGAAFLSKEEFNLILSQAIGDSGASNPQQLVDFASALRHQIQSLSVGGGDAVEKLDAMLDGIDDPGELAANAVDPHGTLLNSLPVNDVITLIEKTRAASDIDLYQLFDDPVVKGLHPIAFNAALIRRRSHQLTFLRAVMSTIQMRQENDPEGAALLRSALRNYIQSDLLMTATPNVYKGRVIDWLNSGGYPDLTPAKNIYDETTGIPATSIGKFNPSLLGSVNSGGKAIAHHVPVHSAIPDVPTAVSHIASGGELSEVPDIFMRDAIIANMGEGLRFLPDSSVAPGFNTETFGIIDTARPGTEPGTYMRYVVKFADRNAGEHIQEIMGSQLEHRLGLFAVGHRVGSPVKKKTDKNGIYAPQRAIVQEHIANLFDGSGWEVLGHWGNVSSSDQIDPENLGRFVALNTFMNHYDRTPANVIAVRAPDGKIHIVPIDDGNGFYGFLAKKAGEVAKVDQEQASGFVNRPGVGMNFFPFAKKLSQEDKLTFAIALRESKDTFTGLDLDKLQQEIIDAHPWTDEELAHIASRFEILKERQQGRDWDAMLAQAYGELGVSASDVDAGIETKKAAVYSGVTGDKTKNSPLGAFQALTTLPKRNLSSGFLWDGPSIDRQQVYVGSATIVGSPIGEDSGKLAVYSTFTLSGDAKQAASQITGGVDGWSVLTKPDGTPIKKPVTSSYRALVGDKANGQYTNKRSLVLSSPSAEFGINGRNYYKQLDDGTVVIVYVVDNDPENVFTGYVTSYKPTADPDNATLSVPNFEDSFAGVLGQFGVESAPASEEVLALEGLRQLVWSIAGGGPKEHSGKSEAELLAILSSYGISIGDLEMAFDADGSPYMRLTKAARNKVAATSKKTMLKHRYYHHDDGEVKAFVNTILTGRLGSARRRIPHGIPGAGWSTQADSGYQSNDYVFFKFSNGELPDPKISILDPSMDDQLQKSYIADTSGYEGGHINSYFPVEFAIERVDSRWTLRDVFGNIASHTSLENSLKSTSAPEPLIRDSMSMARGIHVVPASMYDDVIARIKAQGVTEIAGIPIEALVVSSSDDLVAAFKTLRQYWIDLGWV